MSEIYTLYKITNIIDGKSYIGLTKKPLEIRWYWHVNASKKKIPKLLFHKAIKEYGVEFFSIEVLRIAYSKRDGLNLEKFFIKQYNSLSPYGYNLIGEKLAPELLARIIGRKRPQHAIEATARANKGRKNTPEAIARISAGRIGKGLQNRAAATLTVDQVSIIKKLLLDGKSQSLIAQIYNVNQSCISNIKTGKHWAEITPSKLQIITGGYFV